jgi:hypothetical protein
MTETTDTPQEPKTRPGAADYWAIFSGAVVLMAVMLLIQRESVAEKGLVYHLGGALGAAAVPWILLRLAARRAAWISFGVIAAVVISGTALERANGSQAGVGYQYHSNGCEFAVQFPSKPTITNEASQFGSVDRAQWQSSSDLDATILTSACGAAPPFRTAQERANAKEVLIGRMRAHAHENGLSCNQYSYLSLDIGHRVSARCTKTIQGEQATYQFMMMAGETSIVIMVAGGLTSSYPPPEVVPFFSSLKRVE